MKKILIFTLFGLCFWGCTDQDELAVPIDDSTEKVSLRYGGDGKYDLLGHGCDVTDDFLSGKFRVVDNDKLVSIAYFAINPDETQQRREEIIAGYTAESYLRSITKSKGISVTAGFGIGGLTKSFTSSESYSTVNSFATVQKFIQKKSFSYTMDPEFILDLDCLSPEFKYALSKYDPEKIITMFGTHVYTNVRLGGALEIAYRAKVTKSEQEKIATTEAGAAAAFKSMFNADVKYTITEQQKAISETENYSFIAMARGGNVSIPLSKKEITDIRLVTIVDTYEWEQSIGGNDGKGNVFIDFAPGSLIPLWEFVEDSDLKERLRIAIEKYLDDNQYKDVVSAPVPFYEHLFADGRVVDHYYSTNPVSPAFYGNQGITCRIYTIQEKGTVPLYCFHTGLWYNYYYSTYPGTPGGYSYIGIAGYIYPQQEKGTVPLYSYWLTDGKRFENHYYSTNPNTPAYYSRQTLIGYVYP